MTLSDVRFLLAGSAICLLSACGGGGGGGGSAVGAVSADASSSSASPPSLSFSASPATLAAGESSTLTWESTGADECTASGAWRGSRAISGSEVVSGLTETQLYSLSCSGKGGSTLRDVPITVQQSGEIAVSFQASATEVRIDAQIDLTWSSENADECSASGDWSGNQSLQGTHTTASLRGDATFRLTCTGGGNSAVAIVTVLVVDEVIRWQAPAENVDGTPLVGLDGFNVYWGAVSGSYSDSVQVDADTREWRAQLPAGTYYLAVTALNTLGEESDYSNEIVKRLP